MNPRLFDVALRRERLIERIEAQRERLQFHADGLRRICATGDRAVAAGQRLREHPEWVAAAAIALVVVRPRRAWQLTKGGFLAWRAWTAIRRRWNRLKKQ